MKRGQKSAADTQGRSQNEIAAAICQRIASGEPMWKSAKAEGIAHPTFCDWLLDSQEIADMYTRARESRAEVRADQIDEIATKVERGEIMPDVGRVVLDARKWAASKLAPRRYGDKQQVEHSGEMAFKKIELTPDERLAEIKLLQQQLGLLK